jgi:hypothetical protein
MPETTFFHAVYFYAPAESGTADREALAAGCRTLADIPDITFFAVGEPAGTPRSVVDNSYLVGLLVGFSSSEAHDVYQIHPIHLRFIDENKKYWERVVIYDTRI